MVALSPFANAATQYWDPALSASGTGSGGNGTWATATANWYLPGTGDTTLVTTNVADFSGASANSAVTLTSAVTTGGLKFDVGNYSISGVGGQISITSQASTDGLVVASGVAGTSISVDSIKLGSNGSGTQIQLTNTDLANFNNTTVYLSGNRITNLSNSSTSGTTTFAKFGASDKPTGGTGVLGTLNVNQGNLVINSLAAAANANGTLSAFNDTTIPARVTTLTIAGSSTGTATINGNNTLFNSGTGATATGLVSLAFNMANGTLLLGHDNALGARNANNVLSTASLVLTSGTVAASGGSRNIENAINLNGTAAVGGTNAMTFAGTFTNSGGNRTLNVNNSAATTLSGPVFLVESGTNVNRTLTVSGSGNLIVSGSIGNQGGGGSQVGTLTYSGSSTGKMTLSGTNTYTGVTNINGGVVTVASAEVAGTSGPLGQSAASNPGSISFGGGTLQYSSANNNDYSGRFSDTSAQNYKIDTNGRTVVFANALGASGSATSTSLTLTDTAGTGSLTTSVDQITGVVSVGSGATLNLNLGSSQSLQNSFVTNGTLNITGSGNNALMNTGPGSSLTGSGSFNPSIAAGQFLTISGSMSPFSGTVNLGSSAGTFTLNNGVATNTGSTLATFDLGSSTATFAHGSNANITIDMGALKATGTSTTLAGNRSQNFTTTYSIGAANTDTTFAGRITNGTGDPSRTTAITKVGTATLTLSGNSSYSGATTVNAGTLIVSGSLSGSSAVTVGDSANLATTAILGGSGFVGNVTAGAAANNTGATIDPGNSAGVAGILNAGSLTVQNSAHLSLQIGGTTAGGEVTTGYDQVIASSTVSLSGGDLKLTLNGSPSFGSSDVLYLIINNSGSAVASQFSTVTLNGSNVSDTNNIILNGQQFALVYNANYTGAGNTDSIGNDIALQAVPEPSTWAMTIGGIGMLVGYQRSRRRRNA